MRQRRQKIRGGNQCHSLLPSSATPQEFPLYSSKKQLTKPYCFPGNMTSMQQIRTPKNKQNPRLREEVSWAQLAHSFIVSFCLLLMSYFLCSRPPINTHINKYNSVSIGGLVAERREGEEKKQILHEPFWFMLSPAMSVRHQ